MQLKKTWLVHSCPLGCWVAQVHLSTAFFLFRWQLSSLKKFFSYLGDYRFQKHSEHGKKQILQLVQSEGYRFPWKAHY